MDYFCSKLEWNSNCDPFDQYRVERFSKGIKDCIQKVGLELGTSPFAALGAQLGAQVPRGALHQGWRAARPHAQPIKHPPRPPARVRLHPTVPCDAAGASYNTHRSKTPLPHRPTTCLTPCSSRRTWTTAPRRCTGATCCGWTRCRRTSVLLGRRLRIGAQRAGAMAPEIMLVAVVGPPAEGQLHGQGSGGVAEGSVCVCAHACACDQPGTHASAVASQCAPSTPTSLPPPHPLLLSPLHSTGTASPIGTSC